MTIVSPYVYLWGLNNKVYPFQKLSEIPSGLKCITLAFILGSSIKNQLNPEILQSISELKEWKDSGKEIILSFGGALGPYISDTMNLDTQYQEVLKVYTQLGYTKNDSFFIDFDVEGSYIASKETTNSINNLILLLQKDFPLLKTQFTLAVIAPDGPNNPGGLPDSQLQFIGSAIDSKVNLQCINLMVMDFYNPKFYSKMGEACINTAKKVYSQLSQFNFGYNNIGVTPMIGVNDDTSVFSLDDCKELTLFVNEFKLGFFGYWALNRDNGTKQNLPISSMIDQKNYDFLNVLLSNLKVTPVPVTPTPVPVTPTPAPVTPTPVPVTPVPVTPAFNFNGIINLNNTKNLYECVISEGVLSLKKIKKESDSLEWKSDKNYTVNDIVYYLETKYVCITSHYSLSNWNPKDVPSLWKK